MKTFKKIICVLLIVLTISSSVAYTTSATTASYTYSKLPIIYIKGNLGKIYSKSGERIWPLKTSLSSAVSANMSNLTRQAVKSIANNNWNYLGDEISKTIKPLFSPLLLDKNGNITDGSYVEPSVAEKNKSGKYTIGEYDFKYDMRLDPLTVAASLRTYVNKVLKQTGKSKVNIIARCMGGTVLSAYLYKYKSDPKVNTAIFFAAGSNGILIEEAPFTGSISLSSEALSQYVTNTGEESLASVFQAVTNIFGSKAVAGTANSLLKQAIPEIMPKLLRECYAAFPMYWSFLGGDSYEQAKNFIFNTSSLKKQYAGLIKKIDNYHNKVYLNIEDTLKYVKTQKGVNINIITKFNKKFDPIYDGNEANGDEYITAGAQSFGGTVADYGKKLSQSYCESMAKAGIGKYISSDRKIDASTCLFPDSTWFIRDCRHSTWTSFSDPLVYAIFSKTTQVNVNTYSNFPQFLRYSSGKLINAYNFLNASKMPVDSVTASPENYAYDGNNKTPTITVKLANGEKLTKGSDYKITYEEERASIGRHYAKVTFTGNYKNLSAKKTYFYVRPANVSNLAVSSHTHNSAKLTWNKVNKVKYYIIYYYNTSSKTWKKLGTTTATSYTAKNLASGTSVKLAVKAVANGSSSLSKGLEYASASYSSVTVNLNMATPSIKVTAAKRSATISWGKVNTATSYQIFRSTSKNGIYSKIATVKATKYVNSGLLSRTYYYKVRAVKTVNSTTVYSSYSPVVSVKVQ